MGSGRFGVVFCGDDYNPTEEEIAARMGMDLRKWRSVASDMRMVGLFSASSRAPEDENQAAPEFPAADALNPDVLTEKRQLEEVLSSSVKTLPGRYQTVIEMYYTGGRTMREIGDALGINESRVSQIHKAALDKMNSRLTDAGIVDSKSLVSA